MLYGRYADGSIWAPRGDGPRLLEDMDEVLEEYVRNIFRAYGREYSPVGGLDIRPDPLRGHRTDGCAPAPGHAVPLLRADGTWRLPEIGKAFGTWMTDAGIPAADVPAPVTSEDMVG